MALTDPFLLSYLRRFDRVPFEVTLHGRTHLIGEGEPQFRVIFRKDIPKADLLTSTSLSLGEAYMRGDIFIEGDLFTALCAFLSQTDKFVLDKGPLSFLFHPDTTEAAQREQVSSHYDLGNDFYRLWLDPTMSYSCAYFKTDSDSLEEAQRNKVHYILQKLRLKKHMSLLDIGCGWGFLLMEAARWYGISGRGCTLSREQQKEGTYRLHEAGLDGRVTVELRDYRELPKEGIVYDRLVSVGMLEHVGRENYPLYLRAASRLLREGGLFLLHFIDGRGKDEANPWMRKYIFPGGTLPELGEIISLAAASGFHILDVENLRRHYEKTLLSWYHNFMVHRGTIAGMKGETFCRMWELYLTGCAAAFHVGHIDIHQVLMTKGVSNDLPLTRWY